MSTQEAYKPEVGDVVLCLRPGLRKRVLEVIVPELPAHSGLVVRGEERVELIRHNDMLLIQPAKARELSVVAEANQRSKRQWGNEIPPYMAGVQFENSHVYILPEPKGRTA